MRKNLHWGLKEAAMSEKQLSEGTGPKDGSDGRWTVENPWTQLKKYTDARIALGRTGVSVPTKRHLDFLMSHACAKDAVQEEADFNSIASGIEVISGLDCVYLQSSVRDKGEYLARPDLGRKLSLDSRERLRSIPPSDNSGEYDLCIVLGDGLSFPAIRKNAVPFLKAFYSGYITLRGLRTGPVFLLKYARVACADEIAAMLNAEAVLILIGERPGLTSPDSMGAYITYNPSPGVTKDDLRNCVSNIRPDGFPPEQAARKVQYLLQKAFSLKLTGVRLKDDEPGVIENSAQEVLPDSP